MTKDPKPKDDDKLPEAEAEERFKRLVDNLANTPHKPHKPKGDSDATARRGKESPAQG
jgi:hypothetical protein